MILYRRTAEEYVRDILRDGLRRADVPMSGTTGFNAVWFTTDPLPLRHGLPDGHILTGEERRRYFHASILPREGSPEIEAVE
jgi:hypothetical protein